MRVLVTGADDVWGSLTTEAVLKREGLRDVTGTLRPIESVIAVLHEDIWDPQLKNDPRLKLIQGDIADREQIERIILSERVDSVVHFETVTRDRGSGEDSFDAMIKTNLLGSLSILEACRKLPNPAKLVFCASCSVFEDGMQDAVSEGTPRFPSSTYGTTKAMVEMLVADYARRGFVDGRNAILPMCVSWRPSPKNPEFLHKVFDTPLDGNEIPLRLKPETRLFFNGYHTCIENLLELHDIESADLGTRRSMLQPGVNASLEEMLHSFEQAAAEHGLKLGPLEQVLDPVLQAEFDAYNKQASGAYAQSFGLSNEGLETIVERYCVEYIRRCRQG